MSRVRRIALSLIVGAVLLGGAAVAAVALLPDDADGHRPLHFGCNHNHGPKRTDGVGQRLIDARSLNRQARQPSQ